MIERNPLSQKKWKPHWFYASSAWEFAEGDESTLPRIARHFRILVMRPSRSDVAMQAQLMKLAKKGQSNGLASGSQTGLAGALSQPQCWF
ncbi:hypothetical protein GBA52_024862 [Prunus armeniaca]|nr:hypothetical protein GBA52_024862 [Prunus armeniaca]